MINIAQGNETVTSVAGIGLVGGLLRHCPSLVRLDALRLERTKHGRIPHSRVVLCGICLAALGMNDYADVEDFAADPLFLDAVGGALPSEETCRQRIGQLGADGRALGVLDDVVVELLRGVEPGRVTVGGRKLVVLDIDVSVMAEPCSEHKEDVGWTYKGENGYAPIFAYLGTKGYALAAELRPGTQHCSKEALPFLRRCVALAGRRLGFAPEELLVRVDSGHDDAKFLAELQKMGVKFIVKRNFRREDQEAAKALARGSGREWRADRDWSSCRASPGSSDSESRFGVNGIRQFAELTVKKADRNGQPLLIPEELECWWTNLDCSAGTCIRLYHGHGTSEQCHAELKGDMRLERLPGGKMGANAVTLACGMLALDCLRLIGRHALDHARRRRGVPKRLRRRLRMRARTVIDTMPGSRGMSSGTREPSRSGSARPSGTSRRSSGCSSDVVCNERITEQRTGFLHPRHPGRGGGGASQKRENTTEHDKT